jgi:hypothetical protein
MVWKWFGNGLNELEMVWKWLQHPLRALYSEDKSKAHTRLDTYTFCSVDLGWRINLMALMAI